MIVIKRPRTPDGFGSNIDWPVDAVSAWHDLPGQPWQYVTRADVRRQKIERMEQNIESKRPPPDVERRAAMLHVFWCAGAFGFAFMGWWAYLLGADGEELSTGEDGCKGELAGRWLSRVRELYPAGVLSTARDDVWMEAFARRYRRDTRGGKRQGKAPLWATLQGGYVRALELPKAVLP